MIYLDNAAATPIDERVLRVMMPYLTDEFYNPSAAYSVGRQARYELEEARHQLAKCIGAKPAEIILTAGATESANLALGGADGKIVTTAVEHQAVLNFAKSRNGIILPVDEQGRINLTELKSAIDDNVAIISIGYVNSETGIIQDIKTIAKIVADVRLDRQRRGINTSLWFHTDASQAAGILELNTARLGVDLMTLNAGKCYGPKQVGLLYVRAGIVLKPLVIGGGQEMGLRSGTENIAGAVGFAKALELAEKTRSSEVKRLAKLRASLLGKLKAEIPDLKVNENTRANSPAILNISLAGLDGERVVFALDEQSIMISTGSACAANKGLRSHVLTAMGRTDLEADGSLRLSMGRFTTDDDINHAGEIIVRIICEQLKFGAMNVA